MRNGVFFRRSILVMRIERTLPPRSQLPLRGFDRERRGGLWLAGIPHLPLLAST